MKLCCHFLDGRAISKRSTIVEALTRTGVNALAVEREAKMEKAVVFFDEITPQLYEFLRAVSGSGVARVLAIACSGSSFLERATWQLLQAGASDVFAWDHSENPAAEIAARFDRWESVDRLVKSEMVRKDLIGQTPVWITTLRQVVEVAKFTDAPVLILGESGSGKELLARLIHTLSARSKEGDLVVLDCTTVVPELSGSEFFGHDRGSFTGAAFTRDGAFSLADQGTLFLDEVGELPLKLQAELLRVVQEHTYKRVGSNEWQETDFRLVCATNRNLVEGQARGFFRGDFYSRIAGWTINVPSLVERREDIINLAHHFIKQLRPDKEPLQLDRSVCNYLVERDYPANVRDLKQLMSRIVSRHAGRGPITVGDIPATERPLPEQQGTDWRSPFENAIRRALNQGLGLKEIGRVAEQMAERIAIADEKGNLQRAARKLGVTDRALQMRRAGRRNADGNGSEQLTTRNHSGGN